MSYLLDALRKSEQERQQKTPVPGLQSSAVEWENSDDGRSRSPWLLVAVVAIVLNTVLLAVLVWRFGFAEQQKPADTNTALTAPPPAAVAAQAPAMPAVIVVQQPAAAATVQEPIVVRERREPASLQTIAPRSASTPQSGAAQPASPTESVIGQTGGNNASTQTATDSPAADTDSVERSAVPSVHGLSADIRRQLPYLTMNSHIYANNAKDSFVMINGASFSPGQLVADGLKLVAVVPEGAVLEIHGTRFLLPALATFTP